jgi:hypothetical protein
MKTWLDIARGAMDGSERLFNRALLVALIILYGGTVTGRAPSPLFEAVQRVEATVGKLETGVQADRNFKWLACVAATSDDRGRHLCDVAASGVDLDALRGIASRTR